MEERIINRMLELLDIQQANCIDSGATVSANTLEKPKGGNKSQNSYYYGHLNMVDAIAIEFDMYLAKENGKHVLRPCKS